MKHNQIVLIPSILPPLSLVAALDTTMIHAVAGKLDRNESLLTNRPFRDPYHTPSDGAFSNYVVKLI